MTITLALGLIALGLFIGTLSGFFGIGGGAFLVPILVRGMGVPWAEANALSLTQMIPTAATGAFKRHKQKEVNLRLALFAICGTIPGAMLGQRTVMWLEGRGLVEILGRAISIVDLVLTLFFSISIFIMGVRMIRAPKPASVKEDAPEDAPEAPPENKPQFPGYEAVLLGLVVGFTSACLGIGGGFLFVPIAVSRFGLPVAIAVGTSLFQMPITATTGALLYGADQDVVVPYIYLIPLLIGSLTGVWFGVSFSRRFNNQQYRKILGYTLIIVCIFFLLSSLS